MHRSSVVFVAFALCCGVPALGCAGDDIGDDIAGTTVRMEYADDGNATPLGQVPFPTDQWRGVAGTLDRVPDLEALFGDEAERVASHLSLLDGFGTRPQVEFPLTGPLDPDSVPEWTGAIDGPAIVINIDAQSPRRGQVIAYEWRYDAEELALKGAPVPGTVLDSGTTYAAVATIALLTPDGSPLSPSPAIARLRGMMSVPDRLQSTVSGLAELEAIDELSGQIAGFTVFTTQNATKTMLAARSALEDESRVPPASIAFADPSLVFAGADALDNVLGVATRFEEGPRIGEERWGRANPTGIAHEHVGLMATGELTLPRFRRPSTGDLSIDDGTFDLDEDGVPRLHSMTSIPVTIVLPAAPPPPEGYPVVLFGHGLGSSRHAIVTFAEPLAREGMAVFAIDFDGHGSRFNPRDTRNNTGVMIDDFQGDATIADGFGDITGLMTTFEFLGGVRNFSRARDGIRQSVLDISSLALALRRGNYDLSLLAGDDGVAPTLDTRRVSYLGESFGTLVGGVLAAVEPEIDLYVLDVPGAGIVDLAIVNSPALASFLTPLAYFNFGWRTLPGRFESEISLLQTLVDAADPLTYAPHVLRDRFTVAGQTLGARHVVAIEVLGDEAIHNLASDSLARAMGLQLLTPHTIIPAGLTTTDSPASANVDGQTGVIVQYGPAVHGDNWASEVGKLNFVPGFPHPGDDPFPSLDEPMLIENPLYETLDQVIEILITHQSGETPVVRSTSIPVSATPP